MCGRSNSALCDGVYVILSWIDGKDLERCCRAPGAEQTRWIESGKDPAQIHSIPAPETQEVDYGSTRKTSMKIEKYRAFSVCACGDDKSLLI